MFFFSFLASDPRAGSMKRNETRPVILWARSTEQNRTNIPCISPYAVIPACSDVWLMSTTLSRPPSVVGDGMVGRYHFPSLGGPPNSQKCGCMLLPPPDWYQPLAAGQKSNGMFSMWLQHGYIYPQLLFCFTRAWLLCLPTNPLLACECPLFRASYLQDRVFHLAN
jgi:hypothetical protein